MKTETENRDIFHLTVPDECAGRRIDVLIAQLIPDMSRTHVQDILRNGYVKVNGTVCCIPRTKLDAGTSIDIDAPCQKILTEAKPESIPIDVMYEDDSVLVVNKPAGMVVHPGAGNWSGTLVNAVLGRDPEMADDEDFDPLRPGIVHRLDKDTSGTLIIAKTPKALRKLSRQFADREVEKTYLALVHGWPVPNSAVIKTQYGRNPTDHRKMMVVRTGEGREAITAYTLLKAGWRNGRKVSLLKVRLHTGRTHQIRVHFSYKGWPLLGEKLYSRGHVCDVPRQMLHAWKLAFTHPDTDEFLEFESPIPNDFQTVLDSIKEEKE